MIRFALASLVLAACSHAAPPPAGPKHPAPTGNDVTCPVEIPGTSVTVEDTATGAALVFVTTGDVEAVRSRSKALADMHAKKNGPHDAMGMMIGTKTSAATELDVPGGARIEMTADDPAALQTELRMHAEHLASGTCRMVM